MNLLKTLAASTALLTASPVLAQDEVASEEMTEAEMAGEFPEDVFGALGGMFLVEPLTADQESRLPLAQTIVGKMMPDGTMAEMMEKMMGNSLGPLMELASAAAPKQKLAENLGIEEFQLDMSIEEAAELLEIFDPQWEERQQRENEIMPQMMGEMMAVMEPAMRKAMAELYAINFTTTELGEIDTFFSTETGASFARKSFTMASDPRVMSASMEALPAMMGAIMGMEQAISDATADLTPVRGFSDLSSSQKARISQMTGFTTEQIEENLAIPTTYSVE